jgi:DNA polymerase-3 subunit epsilon
MKLNLKKPLAFFDLETTGIDVVNDRIVEISILRVNIDQSTDIKTMRINPTVPIPKQASEIHGIYYDDIKDSPSFKEVGKTLANFLDGCDLAGYNSNKFDIPLLIEEFLRAGIDFSLKNRNFVDVQVIFHKKEQRTLSAAYKLYCGKDLEGAHGAEADIAATYEVLKAQLDRYDDLENDVDFLSKYSHHTNNVDFAGRIILVNDVETFNFGKHKGKAVLEVLQKEPAYYSWIMNNDFPLYTKKILTDIKLKQFGK